MIAPNRIVYLQNEVGHSFERDSAVKGHREKIEEELCDVVEALGKRIGDVQEFRDQAELNDRKRLERNAFTKLAIKKLGLEAKYPTISAYNQKSSAEEQRLVAQKVEAFQRTLGTYMQINGPSEAGALLGIADQYKSTLERPELRSAEDMLAQLKVTYEAQAVNSQAVKAISKMLYEQIATAIIFNNGAISRELPSLRDQSFRVDLNNIQALRRVADILVDGSSVKRRILARVSTAG